MKTSQESAPVTTGTDAAQEQDIKQHSLPTSEFIKSLSSLAYYVTKKNEDFSVAPVVLYYLTVFIANLPKTMDPESRTLLRMQQILTKQKRAKRRGRTIELTEDEQQVVTNGMDIVNDRKRDQRADALILNNQKW